jgi:hypothetical protein
VGVIERGGGIGAVDEAVVLVGDVVSVVESERMVVLLVVVGESLVVVVAVGESCWWES